MIRTLVEIRGSRVSIRESAETTVTVIVDSELSGPGEEWLAARRESELERHRQDGVADLSAAELAAEVGRLEAELAGATRHADALEQELERYRKAHVCTVECKPNQHTAFQGHQRVADLGAELERRTQERDEREAARAVQEREAERFKAQAYDQNERAAKERWRADQNKAWAERAEARVTELEDRIRKINGAVHSPEILDALRQVARNPEQSEVLANAVRNVRQIIGSPEPETSQA